MIEILGIWMVSGAVAFAAGLPSSLILRERDEGRVAVSADALTHGFVLLTVSTTLWAWLGLWGGVAAAAGWLLILVVAVIHRSWRGLPRVSPPSWVWIAAWVVVIVLSIALRLHNVNFIPWVGDMGAYVNWANEFARTGEFDASWPPLFPIFLGISAALFGTAHTTAAVGLSGILFVIALARLLQRVGANPWVVLGIVALVAVNHPAVWFSTFPVSESINAPIFVVWLMLLLSALKAERRGLVPILVGIAIYGAALGLLRGSGIVLALAPLVMVILSASVRAWRPYLGRFLLMLSASIAGAGVAYWYGVSEIRRYTVNMQMAELLPGPVWSFAQSIGLLDPSPALASVLVLSSTAIAWWGWRRQQISPPGSTSTKLNSAETVNVKWHPIILVFAALLALVLTADAVLNARVWQSAIRLGLVLLIGAILALLIVSRKNTPPWLQLFSTLLASGAIFFLGLHTMRLKVDRGHEFYLYWDRYLFSEFFPITLVLTAVAATWVLAHVKPRRFSVAALATALAVSMLTHAPSLNLQSRDTFFDGAYETTQDLLRVDASGLPRIWVSTTGERPDGFFFPNTWMAFGVPLEKSFGIAVLNVDRSRDNFRPDEVLNVETLTRYLACTPGREAVVHEAQVGGESLARRVQSQLLEFKPLETTHSRVSTLRQPATGGWQTSSLTILNWHVSLAGASPGCGE